MLDVGSGVGKFCLTGALGTRARFVGIEQRGHLVEVAGQARSRLRAWRSRFLLGDAFSLDWARFDALYLFNPFEEHLLEHARIDEEVEFSGPAYIDAIEEARRRLERLRPGTRVVHYWGYGDEMPEGFELLHREKRGEGELELWRKRG